MRRRERGFSMVELIVVVAIGSVIGAGIVSIMMSQIQLTTTQNRNILNQEDMRATLQFMADEIQLMGQGTIEPYVFQATSDSFSFVGDLDGNADPDLVQYTVVNGALHRVYSTSPDNGATWTQLGQDDLLQDVQGLEFQYFKEGNDPPASVNEISSVEIKLTLDPAVNATAFNKGRLAAPSMVQRVTVRNRLLE
jgi:prepilin-type N-terminal cleavage/methylation domain-containing protein